jgi:hypothetical protein
MQAYLFLMMLLFFIADATLAAMRDSSERAKTPLMLSGSLGLSQSLRKQSYYDVANPFYTNLHAQVTLSWKFISIPVYLQYSSRKVTFSQPFNRYGMAPTYKKWKAYLGWSTMNWSPYLWAGLNAPGIGLEYQGDKHRICQYTGRAQKKGNTSYDSIPYDRYVSGVHYSYRGKGLEGHLGFVMGWEEGPANATLPAKTKAWNVAGGIAKTIGKSWHYILDGGLSHKQLSREQFVVQSNSPWALRQELEWRQSVLGIKGQMEYIQPNYSGPALYFIQNDYLAFSIGPNIQLWKSKLHLSAQLGKQILEQSKTNRVDQNTFQLGINGQLSKVVTINADASKFSQWSRGEANPLQQRFSDSSQIRQIDQQWRLGVQWTKSKYQIRAMVMKQIGKQALSENTNTQSWQQENVSFSYSINTKTQLYYQALMWNSSAMDNTIQLAHQSGVNHKLKKGSTGLDFSAQNPFNQKTAATYSAGLRYSATIFKHLQAGLQVQYLSTTNPSDATLSASHDWNIMLNIQTGFQKSFSL